MTEAACDKQKAKAQDTENVMPDAAQADAKTACGCGKEAASSEEKKDTAVAELTESFSRPRRRSLKTTTCMSARWRKSKTPASAQKPMC